MIPNAKRYALVVFQAITSLHLFETCSLLSRSCPALTFSRLFETQFACLFVFNVCLERRWVACLFSISIDINVHELECFFPAYGLRSVSQASLRTQEKVSKAVRAIYLHPQEFTYVICMAASKKSPPSPPLSLSPAITNIKQ